MALEYPRRRSAAPGGPLAVYVSNLFVTEADEVLDGQPSAGDVVAADHVNHSGAQCPRHDHDRDPLGQLIEHRP
jgi:hypothetical protein